MAGGLNFTSRERFERWLESQPVDWARAIATRTALRVLPLTTDIFRDSIPVDQQINLLFCVVRANFISSSVYREMVPELIIGMTATRTAAAAKVAAACAAAAANAATATAAAAVEAALPDNETGYSHYGHISVYSSAAAAAYPAYIIEEAAWLDVSADAQWLADGHGDGGDLLRQKLWLTTDGVPAWVTEYWRKLKAASRVIDAGFAPWLAWYEALVPLVRRKKPVAYFSPELARRIALQPNEWWDRGAKACNADIARWMEEEKSDDSLKEKLGRGDNLTD
jgi:hypothetical protein